MDKNLDWYEMYNSIVKTIEENFYQLSTIQKGWISEQKKDYKNGLLSAEKFELLDNIYVDFKGSYLFKRKHKKDMFKKEKSDDEKSLEKEQFSKSLAERWEICIDRLYSLYEKHDHNIDVVIALLPYEDPKLKSWLTNVLSQYRKGKLKNPIKIKQLNDIFIDWGYNDTRYLNREIDWYCEYKKTMLDRMKYILRDLSYEIDGSITDISKQKEIEKEIIKRMWR